ncbi:MAG: hypothetical protein WAO58_02865 [Fimbriimonadaceae bacterium]
MTNLPKIAIVVVLLVATMLTGHFWLSGQLAGPYVVAIIAAIVGLHLLAALVIHRKLGSK